MKLSNLVLSMLFSLSAVAQERVRLDAKEITINSSAAVVVRTNKTPKIVKINFLVPMEKSICERYDSRLVLRTSGIDCGYDTSYTRVRTGSICTRYTRYGECVLWVDTYGDHVTQHPRTCMVPESYCAQYGTVINMKNDSMKIGFKALPSLGGSEIETFSINGRQKVYDGENVIYDIKPIKTLGNYKVSQKKLLGIPLADHFEITEE